jgi:hypothetical protein
MTPEEKIWIQGSLAASDYVRRQKLHLASDDHPTIVLFDERCRFEAKASLDADWIGTPHEGKIVIPDGTEIPAGVTSFTGRNDKTGEVFFVMALPSVWRAAKVVAGEHTNGLTAIFLHEFMHVTQLPLLQPQFEAASSRFKAPEDLSDDSIQARFKADPEYVAAFELERDLLFQAADEPDPAKAKLLARQAYAAMIARQERWFKDTDALYKPYDDLFLTMEGIGQWMGYAWLADPKGGGLERSEAQNKMRGSRKWWSQDEGLALFRVIDRFVPDWPARAFSQNPALGIDLLKLAAANSAAPRPRP